MTSHSWRRIATLSVALVTLVTAACTKTSPYRTYATPEDAARALIAAVKAGHVSEVAAIFGPDGQALIDTSDPNTARRNREVFVAAVAERWRLEPSGETRVLIVGNEDWPFPVPLVKDGAEWRFDTAAGKEEVLDRRIGRNELAAIVACHAYVVAQRLYATRPHDGQPAGRFATKFQSDPGQHNGLYWPAGRGEKPSPLGDLVARAADEGRPLGQGDARTPFHGYYFRILPADTGFGLVAWPAHYDATGVMTFVVGADGTVKEKDLGPDSDRVARGMPKYTSDESWSAATPRS